MYELPARSRPRTDKGFRLGANGSNQLTNPETLIQFLNYCCLHIYAELQFHVKAFGDSVRIDAGVRHKERLTKTGLVTNLESILTSQK